MSEPHSAFIKLRMTRPELVGWLNASPPSASTWTDGQSLGGRWHVAGRPLQWSEIVEDCYSESFPTNRAALQSVLESAGEAPWLKYAVCYISSHEFVVGSGIFGEPHGLYRFSDHSPRLRGISGSRWLWYGHCSLFSSNEELAPGPSRKAAKVSPSSEKR
jgi:hypothetical protein